VGLAVLCWWVSDLWCFLARKRVKGWALAEDSNLSTNSYADFCLVTAPYPEGCQQNSISTLSSATKHATWILTPWHHSTYLIWSIWIIRFSRSLTIMSYVSLYKTSPKYSRLTSLSQRCRSSLPNDDDVHMYWTLKPKCICFCSPYYHTHVRYSWDKMVHIDFRDSTFMRWKKTELQLNVLRML
jgi:hypothetical protein